LVIRVPAVGVPIPEHEPITVTTGVRLCSEHFQTISPGEILNVHLKQVISRLCAATDKARPDFKRAFKEAVLVSP
jgi:hypothetical protein